MIQRRRCPTSPLRSTHEDMTKMQIFSTRSNILLFVILPAILLNLSPCQCKHPIAIQNSLLSTCPWPFREFRILGSLPRNDGRRTASASCFCHPGIESALAGIASTPKTRLQQIPLSQKNPSQKLMFHHPYVMSSLLPTTLYESNSRLKSLPAPEKMQYTTNNDHYHLTIIIPAYNEVNRIGSTLSTYVSRLNQMPVHQFSPSSDIGRQECKTSSGDVSILVVDDGSTDGTAEYVKGKKWWDETKTFLDREDNTNKVVENCWQVDETVVCISLPQNEGKGAAIERGIKEAVFSSKKFNSENRKNPVEWNTIRSIILVADADGSGDISCVNDMIRELEGILAIDDDTVKYDVSSDLSPGPALVVGYRESMTPKSPLRALLSWGFRTAVSSIFIGADLSVRDTQCGMKLMTASAGKLLYNQLYLRRWTHDVEVIHRAKLLGVPVGECRVPWEDKEGSKLVESMGGAAKISLIMLSEIARMRTEYALGRWAVNDSEMMQ